MLFEGASVVFASACLRAEEIREGLEAAGEEGRIRVIEVSHLLAYNSRRTPGADPWLFRKLKGLAEPTFRESHKDVAARMVADVIAGF